MRSLDECRRFLSERVDAIDYNPSSTTPGYFGKNELPALIEYIEELEERAESPS